MTSECSAMKVRRMHAGELAGAELEQAQEHVRACAKCAATEREIEAEREVLLREVPFPQLAAGVAEKLAQKQRRPASRWMAPLALAAGVLLAVSGALVLRPADTDRVRSKGGAPAQVFVQDASGVHLLAGPVAEGAHLRVSLHAAGSRHVTVTLVEPGEISTLYSGPGIEGPLPSAFEWTGRGRATLRVDADGDVQEIPLQR
ncbi:MAG TPA: hypothetical protein VLW85_03890 [Myxococcales bacterium]|nr:hypothetical protein [Myxococcales bacterium]